MNRLVIIGNGFDLAHGLPTGYGDFIDDYWANIKDSNYNELVSFNLDNFVTFNGHNNFKDLVNFILTLNTRFKKDGAEVYEMSQYPIPGADNRIQIINYNNFFFKIINNNALQNWVDIENLYYEILKSKSKDQIGKHMYYGNVDELNEEFNVVKNLLEKYLYDKVEKEFELFKIKKDDNNDWTKFYHSLKPISITNNEHNLRLEFNDKNDVNDIDIFFIKEQQNHHLNKTQIRLLNFNYTSTLNKYITSLKEGEINVEQIQIHGAIYDKMNKINFGFGDEMDDDYKSIENINDNEYLKNFKSFQYLQNSNYSNLLNFIDSEKFQVLIMGHSCGLSDRTLLNTIFEHKNCRSIKVFFHETKNDKGEVIKDNYTEITQNISRHFNKKKLMREKIVNKTLCQPLPQIQLPKK